MLIGVLIAEAALAAPVTYTLLPEQSRLYVLVRYSRSAAIRGHDHVVAASDFDGKVTWDPQDLGACDVRIGFPISSLSVDPGDARSWEGLDGTTPEDDKVKIKRNLSGRTQLDAESHPRISFQSSSCVASGDRVDVTGTLSMHGVGHAVTASMKVEAGDTFTASGRFSALHTDWGFEPFAALLGALRNDNELGFVIDVRGSRL